MTDRIARNAAAHRDLLAALQAVEYAPPTLAQVNRHLARLSDLLEQERENLAKLQETTKREFAEWKDSQQPSRKRLWTRLKHPSTADERITAMEDREEGEYYEALQREQRTMARIDVLQAEEKGLAVQAEDLQPFADEHGQLEKQLDELYRRVFEGRTQGFPEEYAGQERLRSAQAQFDRFANLIEKEKEAHAALAKAAQLFGKASRHIDEAEKNAQWDVWGGGMMANMMQKSELGHAQREFGQASMLVAEARQLQPAIADVGRVQMPEMTTGDMVFDNIVTDMAFRRKIQEAQKQVFAVRGRLNEVIEQSRNHLAGLTGDGRTAERNLDEARAELDQIRESIMRAAAGGRVGTEIPPAYGH